MYIYVYMYDDFYYITVASKEHPILKLLQKTVMDKGESITVLGLELNKTFHYSSTGSFAFKLKYFWNYVNNPDISTDAIVLFTDAFDVLYMGTREEVIKRYLQFEKPIVFGAEVNCWPDKSVENLYQNKNYTFPYLNSGLFIGRVWAFRKLFETVNMSKLAQETDDQRFWTNLFLTRQDLIELDYNNTLFLNCFQVSKDSIIMESNNSVKYQTSNPLFLHFNGNKEDLSSHFLSIFTRDKTVEKSKIKYKTSDHFIQNTELPPSKNTTFPIVAYCVSYNYMDTLQFMLAVNYLHFDKIYVATQKNDLPTIEFCKRFANVQLLFHNFKSDGKTFDKFGALKKVQQLMYRQYPDHWYLGIDSDILLPTNFIDILENEHLNTTCIYGAVRNNVLCTSELRNKEQVVRNHINYKFNQSNTVIGCFQLHKLKCLYTTNYDNASQGDNDFVDNNFKIRCNLQNLLYFHMGATAKNWKGKTVEFIHNDPTMTVDNMFYSCHVACVNKYYTNKYETIEMPKVKDSVDIFDDVWTCSKKMRDDINDFFKDKSHYTLAEIGAHKGYSTHHLADMFQTVYAVDNHVDWTNFSKNYNKAKRNIKYVHLDIYKNEWNTALPSDIDVSFIDACHSYEQCKSDLLNSIKQFKSLKYVIFDDYGVWEGVKRVVDEAIASGQLIFERFIGIHNVPGPQGIVKYVHEGLICSVNEKFVVPVVTAQVVTAHAGAAVKAVATSRIPVQLLIKNRFNTSSLFKPVITAAAQPIRRISDSTPRARFFNFLM